MFGLRWKIFGQREPDEQNCRTTAEIARIGQFLQIRGAIRKKILGSGNLNEKVEKKRGEAGGSGGKRGEAGGSGGKRGGSGGSGGKRGGSGEEGGEAGGSGEKGGGEAGKNGVKGICAIFSSKGDLEPFCPVFAVYCDFVCVFLFLDRLGMVFSSVGFLAVKNSVLLVPSSVWLFSGRLTLFGLFFGDVQRKKYRELEN